MPDRQPTEKEIALEDRAAEEDRLFSPSAARNRDVIREQVLQHLPATGKVLEIGSGTGEHAVHIAAAAPGMAWFPSDLDAQSRRSIAAWSRFKNLDNVAPPRKIDAASKDWGVDDEAPFAGLVSINMIHIAPFAACEGLFNGAGRLLSPGGKVFLYGPFARNGEHTAPSNEAFDADLKRRDPAWGVRDLEKDVLPVAEKNSFVLEAAVAMPANNFSVILKKNQPQEAR